MSSEKLTIFENILFFLGSPKKAPIDSVCFKCKTKHSVINLGDGDFICQKCWDNWVPTVV